MSRVIVWRLLSPSLGTDGQCYEHEARNASANEETRYLPPGDAHLRGDGEQNLRAAATSLAIEPLVNANADERNEERHRPDAVSGVVADGAEFVASTTGDGQRIDRVHEGRPVAVSL